MPRTLPGTLYDVLEVGPSASQEAVVDAYKRLHAGLAARIDGIEGSDQDTLRRMARLREAFHILSDPERRRGYDARLAIAARAPRSFLKPLLLAGVAGALAIGYATLRSGEQSARQERERIAAEAKLADRLLQREREAQRAAARVDFEHRRTEAIERFNREQAAGEPARHTG